MGNAAEFARHQAARLFAMSLEARASGHLQLSDLLTEAAARYLDRADELESVQSPPLSPDQPGGDEAER